MTPCRVDFERLAWEAPAVGVKFKAHERNGRKLRLAEFTREFVEPDWCTKGHIGYILEGRIAIDFETEAITFGPGDGLFIQPGERHKAKVMTDTVRVILVEDA